MMDSQDNILEQGKQEEVIQAATTPEVETSAKEEAPRKVYETKKEVLDRVKELAHGEEAPQKDEVEYLKTAFYKLHIAAREAQLKEYLDAGGDPEAYQITPDQDEEVFKAEMGVIKERRQQLFREQEAEKEENLKKKRPIRSLRPCSRSGAISRPFLPRRPTSCGAAISSMWSSSTTC